jgi:2-dehydropantoate 2-reductase
MPPGWVFIRSGVYSRDWQLEKPARLSEMRIVVVGPGALGSLFAGALAMYSQGAEEGDGRHEVWLLDHNRSRARQLAAKGLLLEMGGEKYVCPVRATTEPGDIGSADLVLLCVKSYDVASGLNRAAVLLGPDTDTLLLGLQNGIAHLPLLEALADGHLVAVGVTAQGAALLAPGHVRHGGRGLTRVGFLRPPTADGAARLRDVAATLAAGGLETEIVDDMQVHVWAKLFVNAGINALTAIHGCRNGDLLDMPEVRAQLVKAVREATAVARALGIPIMGDPVVATLEVCRATAENISSMLQDVQQRRSTEIDAINGAIVEHGHRLLVPVPVNELLVRKVKEIEANYLL